jgi:putative PEP-CTERM system TPR-repeat lipoprotein
MHTVPLPTAGPAPALRRWAALTLAAALVLGACSRGGSEQELLASARAYMDKQDYAAATIQLKSALQQNEQSAAARLLLGRALLESGNPRGAEVELRKAQDLKAAEDDVAPLMARALLALGETGTLVSRYGTTVLARPEAEAELRTSLASAHLAQGEVARASDATRAALAKVPGHRPALLVQARIKAVEGDLDGAIEGVQQVLARDATDVSARLLLADLLWRGKNDLPGALEAYRKVLLTKPDAVAAHVAVIGLLNQQSKPAEAKAQFEQLFKLAPNHPETVFLQAQFAFVDKDYAKVREAADRLLKVDPDNVRVLELAGAAEFRRRNFVPAEAFLSRVLKVAPNQLLARQLLAQTLLQAGQPHKAVDVLRAATEGDKPDGLSVSLLGEAYLQMGDVAKAEAAFQRAAKIAPENTRVRTAAALSQMMRGNSAVALAELETLAAGDKGPRADLALIAARLRANDVPGAQKAIDGLEKKIPASPVPDQLRGRIHLFRKDLAAATAAFEKASAKDPKYFPAVAALAAIDLENKKPEVARARFTKLLELDPRSSPAMLALAELGQRGGAAPSETLKLLSDAVKANPGDVRAQLTLVRHHLETNDQKAAMAAAQAAATALPDSLEVLAALGGTQLATGDAQQALSTFRRLVALQPTQALHHVRLAEAYAAAKDLDNANRSLRKALEIQPGLPVAQRALVLLAVQDKRPQDGIALAREMQKARPNEAAGWLLEGDVESARKEWSAAEAAYRLALQRAGNAAAAGPTPTPTSSEAAIKLHQVLLQSGRADAAAKLAADRAREQPKDAAFRFYLGDQALGADRHAEAETHYRAVIEAQPNNAAALNNVAWLMVRQGKPGALALAEQANALQPGRAALLDTLAGAQAAEGKLKDAVETQKRALAIEPKNGSYKLHLAEIYIKSGDKAFARAELEDLARQGEGFKDQARVAELLKQVR